MVPGFFKQLPLKIPPLAGVPAGKKGLRGIRRKLSHLAFDNLVYNWSLNNWFVGGDVPHMMHVVPTDVWPGNVEAGQWLCDGAFNIDGEQVELHGGCWEPLGVSDDWLIHMHGFDWLRDLRAVRSDQARRQARNFIESWITRYPRWSAFAWNPALTGRRVANWIGLYDFYSASLDQDFEDRLFDSLSRQCRHLARALPGDLAGLDILYGIKGLAYAGLAFKGHENWLVQALDMLEAEVGRQIMADGGHISRSPSQLFEALKILVDIRGALGTAGYPVPEQLQHTIDRMAQALRFFRYADTGLALFNGAQEGDKALVDSVLMKSNARGKVLQGLPQTGFERLTLGRSLIMMDTGTPPPFPHDRRAHAAPLGFEFVYGRERVLVACGTHPLEDNWQDVLRGSAAHNCLTIDYRNICEVREDGHFGRRPRAVVVHREDSKDAVLIEASHDGYVPLNGITHRRRLYLTENGHDFRGEEKLTCTVGLSKPAEITLRFHLHPKVQVSLIREGKEALLRLGGGAGWRFAHTGGVLSLKNSIYLGEGCRPRKTKQLVIHGQMESDFAQIKWALQRETR